MPRYEVDVYVTNHMHYQIDANSEEDAKEQADARAIDDWEYASFSFVVKEVEQGNLFNENLSRK